MDVSQYTTKTERYLIYIFLAVVTLPIVVGYVWLLISSFTPITHGLIPHGGFTLKYWDFLTHRLPQRPSIWTVTLNTLILAVGLTVLDVLISSMAGYALSRTKFPGRRGVLSLTLILHAFPSVTLLIAIFFVLRLLHLYDTLLCLDAFLTGREL